jgi:hypothetical protein
VRVGGHTNRTPAHRNAATFHPHPVHCKAGNNGRLYSIIMVINGSNGAEPVFVLVGEFMISDINLIALSNGKLSMVSPKWIPCRLSIFFGAATIAAFGSGGGDFVDDFLLPIVGQRVQSSGL